MIKAWAATAANKPLEPFAYDPGALGPDDVEITVETCGICHSDLSVMNGEWGPARYPVVPGHEVIGRVAALGSATKGLKIGQRVGVSWNSGSCLHCRYCLGGEQNLCPETKATIVGRHGGFADKVRAQWPWVVPIPEGLDAKEAGPLMCGGVTVFTPFKVFDVKPTDRVGIVGIGGLGHMALKFANAWGCEVTAFTSTDSKADEARGFGAHHIVNTRDEDGLRRITRTLDLLLVTVNVPLNWPVMMATLRANGRLHVVGGILEPIPVPSFFLIGRQAEISGSPNGSPTTIADMLEFAARHKIAPQTEHFPIAKVNDALQRLIDGKARYRIVLDVA